MNLMQIYKKKWIWIQVFVSIYDHDAVDNFNG